MAQLNIPIIAPVLNQMVTDLQTQFESQTTFYNSVVKRENKGFCKRQGLAYFFQLQPSDRHYRRQRRLLLQPAGLPVYDDMYVYPARVAQASKFLVTRSATSAGKRTARLTAWRSTRLPWRLR